MCDFSKSVFVSAILVVLATLFGGCMVIDASGPAHDHGKSNEPKTVSFAPAETSDDGSVEAQQRLVDQLFAAYQAGQIPWQTVEEAQRELIARARAGKTRAAMKAGAGGTQQAPATSVAAPNVEWWCWHGAFRPISILFLLLFVGLSWLAKAPFSDGTEWASGLVGGFFPALIAAGISYGVGAPAYAARLIPMGVWFAVFWAVFEIPPKDENLVVKFVFAAIPLTLILLVM